MKEKIYDVYNQTLRPVNPGAEKRLGEVVQVLDHGFIYLVDYMGDDASIAQAARVSYGIGTKQISQDEGLIRYLYRNRHTSPFEMNELKFHIKMPIFVARQWIRHRTANVNEYSARYSIVKDEFYIPAVDAIASQSTDNKQGRGSILPIEQAEDIQQRLNENNRSAYLLYEYLLNSDSEGNLQDEERVGVARELARTPLPLSSYTEMYWKIDLHNLLHFQGLRMDPHAQWEIRQYANVIGDVLKDGYPITWKAFEDYQLNAKLITGPEINVLAKLCMNKGISLTPEEIFSMADSIGLKNKREREEMIGKFKIMGLVK